MLDNKNLNGNINFFSDAVLNLYKHCTKWQMFLHTQGVDRKSKFSQVRYLQATCNILFKIWTTFLVGQVLVHGENTPLVSRYGVCSCKWYVLRTYQIEF